MTNGRTAPAAAVVSGLALVLALALMLVALVSASGCSQGQQSLVGTWSGVAGGERLDFRADGTLYLTRASGAVETLSWQAEAGSVSMARPDGDEDATFGYSIDEDVLTLTYGAEEPAKYTRVQQ